MRRPPAVTDRQRPQPETEHDQGRRDAAVGARGADPVQAVDEGAEGGAAQHEAGPVEGAPFLGLQVRDEAQDQAHAQGRDRDVQEEDPGPVQKGDDEAAERRTDHWRDQPRRGGDGDGGDQVLLLGGAQQHEVAHRGHQGGGQGLQHPRADELPEGMAHAAERRSEGEAGDGRGEDVAGAQTVGDPGRDRQEGRHHQDVDGDAEAEVHRRQMEGAGHLRQGGGDHRRVQRAHEHGGGDDQGDQPRVIGRGPHGSVRTRPITLG